MIFDAHVHMMDNEGRRLDDVLQLMEENQIDRAAIMPGGTFKPDNDYTAAAKRKHPDKFEALAWINPHFGTEAVEECRRRIRDDGFRGIKIHPTFHACSFERHEDVLAPLMELAAEEDVPVLFHTGDYPFCLPQSFDMAAAAYPATKIIMGHMSLSFIWNNYVVKLAAKRPNIYLETSQYPLIPVIQEAIDTLGSERVIYGSDMTSISPAAEITKLNCLTMSDADRENVFAKNIMRLMNLD